MSDAPTDADADADAITAGLLEQRWLALVDAVAKRLPVPASADEVDAPASRWRSLDVVYQPPHVERLYTFLEAADLGDGGEALLAGLGRVRLSLHLIHHCSDDEALFHPHPWPSAMRIVAGGYRMRVGRGANDEEPLVSEWVVHGAGASYAMCDRNDWHAVVPGKDAAALTVMLSGEPWAVPRPMPSAPPSGSQPRLARERVAVLVALFDALGA